MNNRATPQYIVALAVEILRQRRFKELETKDFNFSQGHPWRHNKYAAELLDSLMAEINDAVNGILYD